MSNHWAEDIKSDRDRSNVSTELTRLGETQEQLASNLTNLAARLEEGGVLIPAKSEPEPTESLKEVGYQTSDLAQRLQSIEGKLSRNDSYVRDLIARLDI